MQSEWETSAVKKRLKVTYVATSWKWKCNYTRWNALTNVILSAKFMSCIFSFPDLHRGSAPAPYRGTSVPQTDPLNLTPQPLSAGEATDNDDDTTIRTSLLGRYAQCRNALRTHWQFLVRRRQSRVSTIHPESFHHNHIAASTSSVDQSNWYQSIEQLIVKLAVTVQYLKVKAVLLSSMTSSSLLVLVVICHRMTFY